MTQAPEPKDKPGEKATEKASSNEKDEKSGWNTKLAEIIVQAIGGGGLVTFTTLLSGSDLPKIAIAGLLGSGIAPIVFAVAEPISKKLKKGAEFAGEATASNTETATQKLLTGFSGFERKYLEAVQSHCYALEVEGFRGSLPPLALADVVIPLRLNADRGNVYGEGRVNTTIWHFLPTDAAKPSVRKNRLAVIADPGYGKTTLTRYLALSYSNQTYADQGAAKQLPVLLRFRDFQGRVQSETDPKLETLIVSKVKELPSCGELQVTEPWMKQQLKAGKCLVMLDGLDEVPQERREILSRWANRQMQEYPSFFILTSRPHGYDASLFQGVQQLGILNFTSDDKRDFLNKWYCVVLWRLKWETLWKESQQYPEPQRLSESQAKAKSDDDAQKAATDLYKQIVGNVAMNTQLAVNPLLLTIVAATHNAFDALPERRVTLYRKMFDLLLEDRPNRRETRLKLKEATQNRAVLQALALSLTQEGKTQEGRTGKTQFTSQQGAAWIQSRLSEQAGESDYTPKQFLNDIEKIAGLLTGGDGDLYQFAHTTFQEYLAAAEIKSQGSEALLLERLQGSDWQRVDEWVEIFSFYAALEEADLLVKTVVALPEGENRTRSLALLHRIVKEEKSRIVQPELRQRLDELLETTQFGDEVAAKISLEQRFQFQHLIRLDNQTEITQSPIWITQSPICWGEYQQFLEAQNTGQFHSTAQPQKILPDQINQPVTGISEDDRQWFCAWLSTQTSLQADDVLFTYELPKAEQYQAARIRQNGQLYVVRRVIHPKYAQLLSYLASASWREADNETYRLMITTVGKEEGEWFDRADLENFPCPDLRTLDQLWVQYSHGKWGFSVQKRIWQECGSPMTYNDNWKKFGDRVGWRKDDDWINSSQLTDNLEKSLTGEFPGEGRVLGGVWGWGGGGGGWWGVSSLAQRLVNCSTSQF